MIKVPDIPIGIKLFVEALVDYMIIDASSPPTAQSHTAALNHTAYRFPLLSLTSSYPALLPLSLLIQCICNEYIISAVSTFIMRMFGTGDP